MSALIKVDVIGLASSKNQLKILMMTPARRKKLVRLVAYRVRGDSQKRVRRRIDLDGKPFHPHPGHTKRKHTFDTVARYISVTDLSDKTANLGWKISGRSRLAAKIQYGSEEYVNDSTTTADRLQADKACSVWQARQLVAYGYTQDGKKGRKPATVRWLRGKLNEDGKRANFHMTYKKAAAILDTMRRQNYKKSRAALGAAADLGGEDGKVNIPARSFLGATQQEIANYIDTIFEQMEQEMKRGIR
jgi:phage gpG-like protein